MPIRLITDPPLDGAVNMGIDTALLHSVSQFGGPPTLRLYSWRRPTLTLGYGQSMDDLDVRFLIANHIPAVRRPSGGRALLHYHELTYALALPEESPLFGSLGHIYGLAASAIQEAFSSLGLSLHEGSDHIEPPRRTPCCHATSTRYEFCVHGKKVAPAAQRRLQGGALQHGSIIMSIDKELYLGALHWPDERKKEAARAVMGGVSEVTGRWFYMETIRTAFIEAFARLHHVTLTPGSLTPQEIDMAREATALLPIESVGDGQPAVL